MQAKFQEGEEEIAPESPSPPVSPSLTESEGISEGLSAAKITKEPEEGQGYLSHASPDPVQPPPLPPSLLPMIVNYPKKISIR